MKQALNNLMVRADEIVRTLRWALPHNDKWQAYIGMLMYHTTEVCNIAYSRAKYRYGVEIEFDFKFRGEENQQVTAIVTRNLLRTALSKNTYSVQHDESLACGFEIITAPFSLNTMKKLQVLFDDEDVMKCLDKRTDTSGLHITVDPIETREQERLFFDYFNNPRHIGELEKVIGRLPNKYCRFRDLKNGLRVIKDHKYIVHVRKNRALEVRAFKSPNTWDEFWQRLMLVHRVNKLVRETNLSAGDIHKKIMRGVK